MSIFTPSILKIQAPSSSKTLLLFHQATQYLILDNQFHIHHHKSIQLLLTLLNVYCTEDRWLWLSGYDAPLQDV
jgi:hypothetical protein